MVPYCLEVVILVKKAEKVEELKIRLSTEDKDYIKAIAKANGVTMSKFVLDSIVPKAKTQIELIEHKENIDKRIVATEEKIQNLKAKMQSKKGIKNKSIFEKIFARKS